MWSAAPNGKKWRMHLKKIHVTERKRTRKSSDWSSRFGPKGLIVDKIMKKLKAENDQEIEV